MGVDMMTSYYNILKVTAEDLSSVRLISLIYFFQFHTIGQQLLHHKKRMLTFKSLGLERQVCFGVSDQVQEDKTKWHI